MIRTQEYYKRVFQFEIDWRDGESFGSVSNGDVALFFQKADPPAPGYTVVLNTENADVVYETLKNAGADITDPIETRYWGVREFSVRDLNGHVLRISHVDERKADDSTFVQGWSCPGSVDT